MCYLAAHVEFIVARSFRAGAGSSQSTRWSGVDHIASLRKAVAATRQNYNFTIAFVVLPDHLHAIWNLRYVLPLTSWSLEFSHLEFIAGGQAAAIPPDGIAVPANKQSVFRALIVGFEVAHVSARGREKVTGRGASIPGLVAVLEACLATIGAIAAGSLKLGKPGQR